MIDNLGGRLGSFDRLEKELPPGAVWSTSTARSAAGAYFGPAQAGTERAAAERADVAFSGRNSRKDRAEKRARRTTLACAPRLPLSVDGEGHREAHPAALADLVPHGRAPARDGTRDPARRRGLQRDERGRVRAALLRRSRRARRARHQPHRRQARRRRRRAGELLAAAGELPPPRDRVHRRGARLAAVRAQPARRRVRLRRAAAARAPADLAGAARARSSRPDQRSLALGITASAGGHELSQRLAKVETAIFRQKTITFDYFTMERDETGARKVDPYHLLFRGGQFYLLGWSHEREAIRVFRLSRIRGKVAYATKAEHDFKRPTDFDPRVVRHARRLAVRRRARASPRSPSASAWPGRSSATSAASARCARPTRATADIVFATPYASARQLVSFVLGLGEHAHVAGPRRARRRGRGADRADRAAPRRRVRTSPTPSPARRPAAARPSARSDELRRRDAAIRPERFARLVTLASILIQAGRAGERLPRRRRAASVIQVTEAELREDINVLNVVNFGGGSYVLYAEIHDDGTIEVDPEPYADNFDRPARLLPVEAKALIAAIDLIGDHLPAGRAHRRAREDRRRARRRPARAGPAGRRRRRRRLGHRARRLEGDLRPQAAEARLLQGQRGRVQRADRRAVRARQRPGGLVRRDVRPREGRRAPLPPGPRASRRGAAQGLHAAARGRPRRRRRGLAEDRRGSRLADRARVDQPRARPLGARGPRRRAAARRRLADRRAELRRRPTGSCARCSRRPATPPSSSPQDARDGVLAAVRRLRKPGRA